MRQESFIFFTSWLEAIKPYDEDMQNQIIRMILDYAVYGVEPDLSALSSEFHTVFTLVKPLIDAHKRNKENGNLGGRPKTKKTHEKTHEKTPLKTSGFENKKPNDNVNVNVNVNDNDNDKEIANAKKKEKEDVATSSRAQEKKPYINPILENEVIDSDSFRDFRTWQKQFTPITLKLKNFTNLITEKEFWYLLDLIDPIGDDGDDALEKIKKVLFQIENRHDLQKRYKSLYRTTLNWLKKDGLIKKEETTIEDYQV